MCPTIKGGIKFGLKASDEDKKKFMLVSPFKTGNVLKSDDVLIGVTEKGCRVYSEKELESMSKTDKVVLLKKLGVNKIPKFEKNMIKTIIKLQECD